MDKLRVAHISTPLTWRGGEQQVAYLMDELRQTGDVQQRVFCPKGSAMEAHCAKSRIDCEPYERRSSLDWQAARQLAHFCKAHRLDIVHLHDSHAHSLAVMSASLFGNPTRFILSRRVDFPLKGNPLSAYKYNHSQIKKILCVSEAVHREVVAKLKNPSKAVVVHSGIDLSRFRCESEGVLRRSYQIPQEIFLVGNVAAIAPHKDYFTFIDTVAELVEKGLNAMYFAIGGDGGEQTQIEAYAREKGVENQIIFTGFREDIPQVLPELDVFLFTSKTEGLGTSALDAFASCVPVVATRAGGIPESVRHEETGLLAPVGDSKALAENVLRMLREHPLRKKLVRNARQRVERFSKAETARKTLQAYREAM